MITRTFAAYRTWYDFYNTAIFRIVDHSTILKNKMYVQINLRDQTVTYTIPSDTLV